MSKPIPLPTPRTARTGAIRLVRALERQGVREVFGYPGGAIMPVYDALLGSRLRHVLVRHEQAAALAADGYARAGGRVGVCMATSGPGATNLITGIANAHLDSVPMVAITGQVPTTVLGTDAFQEVDVFGMTLPIVKHSFLVRDPADVDDVVDRAFALAASGRPGPVLIDLPKDVACAVAPRASRRDPVRARAPDPPDPAAVAAAALALRSAARPLLYAGGGVGMAGAVEALRALIARTGLPTVTTLKGLGAIAGDAPEFLGMLGMHGSRAANRAVDACDLLLCVGARFDDRATGALAGFAPRAKVVHMDVDPAEIGKRRHADVAVLGDLRSGLSTLAAAAGPCEAAWREHCARLRREAGFSEPDTGASICAPRLLRRLSERAPDAVLACDVGQHQMWVAQHCRFARPERHLSSGGLGTMGYGLPAAIGAQLALPRAQVVNVTGDGSFMMNVQELATVVRYRLPIKIVLLDNQALGLVRQWQECFHARRFSEVDLSDNPDFAAVARAFGIPAFTVDREAEVPAALDRLLASAGPLLVHVRIDAAANVWPLVPPGAANVDMIDEVPR